MGEFNTVGIVGRREANAEVADTLAQLVHYLKSKQLQVVLESNAASVLPRHGLPVHTHDELGSQCDLAIVVGGDGSMLTAARALAKNQVPVVGVNRGGLGFLTDISPEELEQQLDEVFAGRYSTESRFLLSMNIRPHETSKQQNGSGQALNDIVLSSGQSARMIEFELYIDDHFVYSQRSNGLIVSTPTGSTAYALSGGGPIMHPNLDAIVLVPMFPHTLTARPVVVEGNSRIKIVPGTLHDTYPLVSCDGHNSFTVAPGDEVFIRKLDTPLTLIHPIEHDFYESCRSKLGWGSRLGD